MLGPIGVRLKVTLRIYSPGRCLFSFTPRFVTLAFYQTIRKNLYHIRRPLDQVSTHSTLASQKSIGMHINLLAVMALLSAATTVTALPIPVDLDTLLTPKPFIPPLCIWEGRSAFSTSLSWYRGLCILGPSPGTELHTQTKIRP